MVRARCSICTEAIQEKAGACPFKSGGHVYHLDCLNRWLSPNRTCPTCRKSASKAIVLYFDLTDLNSTQQADDPDVLENQIVELKLSLQQKDLDIREIKKRHKNEIAAEKAALLTEKDLEIENVRKQYEKKLQIERSTIAGLKKQLVYLKDKETELAVAQCEASELRTGYEQMKRMKTLIDNNASEAEAMLRDLDSKSFPEVIVQLITLKKKLEEKRSRCKEAVETTEQHKKENHRLKTELTNRQMELRKCKDNLKMAEEDINRLEKENASYQKKLTAMERAFASPSPRSSAIGRLIRESPAPMDLKRPRLSPPIEDAENAIVPETPSPKSQRTEGPRNELKSVAEEMGLSLVKTTSATASFERAVLKPTQQHQLHKNPVGSSVFKTGYNGLGGHTKFLVPLRPTKMAAARKVARPNGISKFIKQSSFTKVDPPLPVMNLDFS